MIGSLNSGDIFYSWSSQEEFIYSAEDNKTSTAQNTGENALDLKMEKGDHTFIPTLRRG